MKKHFIENKRFYAVILVLLIFCGCLLYFIIKQNNQNTTLKSGTIEDIKDKQEDNQLRYIGENEINSQQQEGIKNSKSIDIFSRQEKCHNHLKEAESRYDDYYVNVYYSPVLDTCILDVSWMWDGDESGIMYLANEWNLKDFYTDKQIFSCTMFRDSVNKNDWFVYDEKYFDEDTISLFEAYGNRKGECNYLYDWASEYLQN